MTLRHDGVVFFKFFLGGMGGKKLMWGSVERENDGGEEGEERDQVSN